MPIHYSEGAFPLTLYSNNYRTTFRNGYHLENICGCHCTYGDPGIDIHDTIKKHSVALMVTDVGVTSELTLSLTISFSDGTKDKVRLEKGTKYKIQYLEDGQINAIVGVITSISKVGSMSSCVCSCCNGEDYVIMVDASTEFSSKVYNIRTSSIRSITPYIQYAEEDTTIVNARTSGATVAGQVSDLFITNATVDKEGNISGGLLSNAVLDKDKCIVADGCATGVNPLNHQITVTDAQIIGGSAISGNITSGKVDEFTLSGGELDPDTGLTKGATLTAKAGTIVATNCNIVGSKAYNGTFIQPKLEYSTVIGGTRSGNDMITVGATVIGDIAYGGSITGGTLYGGVASGMIDGKPYSIINGETTGGTTILANVKNGKIVGGKKIGNTIIGATIYGGVATAGTTTCGNTVLGHSDSFIKPEYISLPEEIVCHCPKVYATYKENIADVIIWWKTVNNYTYTSNYDTVYNGPRP